MVAPTVGAYNPDCSAKAGRKLPTEANPQLAEDAEVFLYIHGMDSRLEEAMDVTHALHELGRVRGKNYTVISVDLPTSGYATNVDYNDIAPLDADGHASGGIPAGFSPNRYVVPIVDFIEDYIVAFVNELDHKIPIKRHLKAYGGGSLGGNMCMRLGRRNEIRHDAPWLTNGVCWSPAAIWPSFADDGMKHAGLSMPWYLAGGDANYRAEADWSRRSFFYGGFDWQSKALGFIKLGGGQPQAWYWYREGWGCKAAHMRLGRIDRYETYNEKFRRWHWRLGMEQLLFSQRINRNGLPLYKSNNNRMLLLCGFDDVGGDLCEDTRQVAEHMDMTPGYALFLHTTGHSIHNERPNFLARHAADFVEPQVHGITMELDSNRNGSDYAHNSSKSPMACRDQCQRDARCKAYTYVRPNSIRQEGTCYLKGGAFFGAAPPRTGNVDCVSGVK
jgi:hypothetical protein